MVTEHEPNGASASGMVRCVTCGWEANPHDTKVLREAPAVRGVFGTEASEDAEGHVALRGRTLSRGDALR